MKLTNSTKGMLALLVIGGLAAYFTACNNDSGVTSGNMTDDQYVKSVVTSGTGSNNQDEADLMSNETTDMNDGGAVSDNDGGPMDPVDSLIKWGRIISNVDVNVNITNYGDTMKAANITRTISGNYVIIGIVNGSVDTIVKPYTEVLNRLASFRRIARTEVVSRNWKLYQVSMLNGQTTSPQVGTSMIVMNKLQVYVNGALKYNFNGPDFTQNIFTTMYFGGAGVPSVDRGDQVQLVLSEDSKDAQPDIVAWHWARNTFGFHRVPFVLTSNVWDPSMNVYHRTYSKSFTIFSAHRVGVFNGYISASTYQSLRDNTTGDFASVELGTPYKILR